jgi:hypothetical protein
MSPRLTTSVRRNAKTNVATGIRRGRGGSSGSSNAQTAGADPDKKTRLTWGEDLTDLLNIALAVRGQLDVGFDSQTAAPGTNRIELSSGQCAAAAIILQSVIGGNFVSAKVASVSHWFNRVARQAQFFDIDITGDQFGFPAVRIAPAGTLYEGTRVRDRTELNANTIQRARRLAARTGFASLEGESGSKRTTA